MIFFLFFINAKIFHKTIDPSYLNESDYAFFENNKKVLSNERQPIRIEFEETIINGYDPYKCEYIGQIITWEKGTFTCIESDILNEERKKLLLNGLNDLKIFLNETLKVNPVSKWLTRESVSGYYNLSSKYVECDLYIILGIRPYGGTGNGHTRSFRRDPITNRTLQAGIFISGHRISTNPMRLDLLKFLYHEIMHVLVFAIGLYPYWIDPLTKKSYGNNLPLTIYQNNNYPNKNFTILHTPILHRFVSKRFGVDKFWNSIPSGLELEDGGGSGTELSHPEARVYFGDVCTSISAYVPTMISDLSFAALEDTGWFDVNYSKAVQLPWGHGYSFGDKLLFNFPTNPPAITFPEHYLCKYNWTSTKCSYDYSGYGPCDKKFINCNLNNLTNEEKSFCLKKKWSDPLNYNYMGSTVTTDYMIFPRMYMAKNCLDESLNSTKTGETFNSNSFCHSYKTSHICLTTFCNNDNTLTIKINNISKICHFEGEEINFEGSIGIIKCSSPIHICKMIEFRKKLNFNPYDDQHYFTPIPNNNNLNNNLIYFISIFIIILLISSIYLIFIKKNSNLENEELNIPL